MKDKKRRVENHLFYDFDTIERHLAKMAAKGWRLERIGRMFWHYRRAPAKKLTYAVEYFEKGSDFHATLPESQQQFLEYCAASGWELVGTWAQMMILVSEADDPIPIETEPATRLETIRRAMWKNYLPGTIVLIVLAMLQIAMNLSQFFRSAIDAWSGMAISGCLLWLLLGVLFGVRLVHYGIWTHRAACAVRDGMDLPTSNARWLARGDYVLLALAVLILLMQYANADAAILCVLAITYLGFYLNVFLTDRLRELLKRKNVSTAVNRVVSIAFCALFSVALTAGAVWYGISQYEKIKPGEETYTYKVHDDWSHTVTLERDTMPLTLEDLDVETTDAVSYEADISKSIFLTKSMYWQTCYEENGVVDSLGYDVLDIHWDALYDVCLNEWLDEVNEDDVFAHHWEPIDPAAWRAERVYRLYWDEYEEFGNRYLVCWSDRIVQIDFERALDPAQIASAAAKLMIP